MAAGLSNGAIAASLHISTKTVERHATAIFDALGVSARAGGQPPGQRRAGLAARRPDPALTAGGASDHPNAGESCAAPGVRLTSP